MTRSERSLPVDLADLARRAAFLTMFNRSAERFKNQEGRWTQGGVPLECCTRGSYPLVAAEPALDHETHERARKTRKGFVRLVALRKIAVQAARDQQHLIVEHHVGCRPRCRRRSG